MFALRWSHVDLEARRIHVRESVDGPLKDKDSRMVPVLDALVPILKAWKLKSGGEGRVIPPLRRDGDKIDLGTIELDLAPSGAPIASQTKGRSRPVSRVLCPPQQRRRRTFL